MIGFRFLDITLALTKVSLVRMYIVSPRMPSILNSCDPPHVNRGIPYGQGLRRKEFDEVLE